MPKAKAAPKDDAVTVAGIAVTHPDRLLWPAAGVTKRDLADYCVAVADRLLPQVANRPLTLLRCPGGSEGECFVQKHPWPGLSKAVRRLRDGDDEWLVVDDAAGLVALVQMGVLEFHPWGATADDLEHPDRVVFDFDPDEGVPWARVVEGAKAVRARLDGMGLQSFLKSTGGKGLHVVIPIEPHAGWEAVKAFAHGIAERLVDDAPDRYTTNPLKEARHGRVFLDHLRNSRGATAVAAFSPRARAGAPIAVPLAWEALGDDPATVRRVLTDPPADTPWPDFSKLHQRLPG
ncbi:non-homologous end-joining DNA ligase [Azospirillum rugosum]|uniref:DNA ligase D n=1 Tax=Azospirillum rugosum TaxID=416170 RepID=A0ABS4SJA3_9PROT|nr:non-homologous end-joining DNA ligase [Azospirillum rugosum]MBP2292653.1 DNA ligase D [Azospirillum rugosum]MDQ0526323.1 DNA ligase D [Azospirillum rugosum]